MSILHELYGIAGQTVYYKDKPMLSNAMLPVLDNLTDISLANEYYDQLTSNEFFIKDFKIDFLRNFSLISTGFSKLVKSNRLTASFVDLSATYTSKQKIKNVKEHHLAVFKVSVPENVISPIDIVTYSILELSKPLATIESEMLDPLLLWTRTMLSDPEYVSKAWAVPSKFTLDVDRSYNLLRVHFDDRRGDGSEDIVFFKAYSSVSAFNDITDNIKILDSFSNDLLNGKIISKMDSITANLQLIYENNKMQDVKPEKITPVRELALYSARAIELLSIIMFEIKSISYVHGLNIEKINTKL